MPDTANGYPLPGELARYVSGTEFNPGELRGVCRRAGRELGREGAGRARFLSAAEMVALWSGLDLPAWEAPYVLRDARLGYLDGYDEALTSGTLTGEQTRHAAEARWGEGWRGKLDAARARA